MNEDIGTKISNIILNFLMINMLLYGLIGNFLCFKIFTSTKLKKYPISIYFRVISIIDSLVLIEEIHFLMYFNFDFYLNNLNDTVCKIDSYFLYTIGPISPWLMVVVSLDRFINSAFPKRFPFIHKIRTQIGIILFFVLFNLLLYSSILWRNHISSSNFYLYLNLFYSKIKNFNFILILKKISMVQSLILANMIPIILSPILLTL